MITHLKIPKYDVYFQEVDVILAISDEVDIVCTFVITGEVAPILNKFGLTQICLGLKNRFFRIKTKICLG